VSAGLKNPFLGLRPFEAQDDYLFFGREDQVDDLLTRLRQTRFLAVVGTSGSGKSSLVRAGLVPALRGGFLVGAGSRWRVCIMRPGDDPVGNLARSLIDSDVLRRGSNLDLSMALTQAALERGALGLAELIRQSRADTTENILIVVDQFEELFRFRQNHASERGADESSAFVKLLLAASSYPELPLYCLLTMRTDGHNFDNFVQFRDLPEAVNSGLFLVPRLTREQLRSVIVAPVAVSGARIAPRLATRVLNDLGEDQDQLPILQHAMMRTWDIWHADHATGEPLDLRHYEAAGGLVAALLRHGDEILASLSARSRDIAKRLFACVTYFGGDNVAVRRPTAFSEVRVVTGATSEELRAVVERFRAPDCSFLTPPPGTPLRDDTVIDIAHESLARIWLRLRDWAGVETAATSGVYLAQASIELAPEHYRIRRELEQFGYTVLPASPLPLSHEVDDVIRENLARTGLAIHLVGSRYGTVAEGWDESLVELQYRLAGEESNRRGEFRRLSWCPRGTLYLIGDANDSAALRALSESFDAAAIEVYRTLLDGSAREIRSHHHDMLRRSDAVLVYWGSAPESWVFAMLNEIRKSHGSGGHIRVGVLVAEPRTEEKLAFRATGAKVSHLSGTDVGAATAFAYALVTGGVLDGADDPRQRAFLQRLMAEDPFFLSGSLEDFKVYVQEMLTKSSRLALEATDEQLRDGSTHGASREVDDERRPEASPAVPQRIFLSFARSDNVTIGSDGSGLGWVDAFHRALLVRLKQVVGRGVDIWRDSKIDGNETLTSTLEAAIRGSGFFIPILSPSYANSEWCRRELELFLNMIEDDGIQGGNISRVIPVYRLPLSERIGLGTLLDDVVGYKFYAEWRGTPMEFDPQSKEFLIAINELAYNLSSALRLGIA
jgi:energy-coupling factor transporter ATP-binding protein EcfA2